MQARSLVAPARALAAAGVLHLVFGVAPAASRSQNGTEAVRARAEELAEAATRRFDELLKGESPAQAEHARPAILEGPWKEALAWIERSNRDFAVLMRRLAGEVGSKTQAGSVSQWLGRSRERFETIMRGLTDGAAPTAEHRSVAAPAKPPEAAPSGPPVAGAPIARHLARETGAGGAGSERPLAERRRAEPTPAVGAPTKTSSPAPGREPEKTLPERRPNAEIAAPAGAPPSQAVARAKTTAPRRQLGEASAAEAGKGGPTERSGEVAPRPAPGPEGTAPEHKAAQRRARHEPRGADIAAAPAPSERSQSKTGAERAHRENFAERRLRRTKRAVPPAAAPTAKAAASAAWHRAARRGARHRHRRELHACAAADDVALPGWYVVKKGDTLWGISRRHYGAGRRYRRIAAANGSRLHGTTRIHPCERLYLPDAPRG
jgi:nucleoid-associated protein YgaU